MTRGALDCKKSFEVRIDINVPSNANCEYRGTNSGNSVSNEFLCAKSEKSATDSQKAVSGAKSDYHGINSWNLIPGLSTKNENPAVNLHNAVPSSKIEYCGMNSYNVTTLGNIERQRRTLLRN